MKNFPSTPIPVEAFRLPDLVKNGADVLSLGVVLGSLTEFLPAIAALFAIIWTAIRIFEWFRVRVLSKRPIKFLDMEKEEE